MRIAHTDFFWCDLFYINPKGPRHRRLAEDFFAPLGGERRCDGSDPFKARGNPCLCLQRAVKLL